MACLIKRTPREIAAYTYTNTMSRYELRSRPPDGYNSLEAMTENRRRFARWQRLMLGVLFPLFLASLALLLITEGNRGETAGTPASLSVDTSSESPAALVEQPSRGNDGKLAPVQPPGSFVTKAEWPAAIPESIDRRATSAGALATESRLEALSLPPHDYFETARLLGQYELGERTVARPPVRVGDRETFFTANGPRQAELLLISENGYYWAELGLTIDPALLAAAVERAEEELLPALIETFGQAWQPGVDHDDRFHVLHVNGSPDVYELGYFTDENQFPRSLFAESNEREMVYLNMARLNVGSDLYLGTLVHEWQHLIQWNLDANEAVWLNEGLSQLAETMVGLDTVNPSAYSQQPQIRLDRWSTTAPDIYAHYAGSYLFLRYLLQRAGPAAIAELARHPANSLAAIQTVLDAYMPGLTWRALFLDWVAAMYLDDPLAGPVYDLADLELSEPSLATRARVLPLSTIRALPQLGVEFIDLDLTGSVGITFAGQTTAPLTSEPPPDGGPFWHAPPGNSSQSTLTTAADLTGLAAPRLVFDAFHDLEPGWDFAYVSASADGGQSWDVLTPSAAKIGPYGPALGAQSVSAGGTSPGWQHYEVDLARYAGLPVQIRLDVLSDPEGISQGVGLTGLEIPEFRERGGQLAWRGDGFEQVEPELPQRWGVVLIRRGDPPTVHLLDTGEDSLVQVVAELGEDGGVLAVVPLSPAAHTEATYWLEVRVWDWASNAPR